MSANRILRKFTIILEEEKREANKEMEGSIRLIPRSEQVKRLTLAADDDDDDDDDDASFSGSISAYYHPPIPYTISISVQTSLT
jgi:hypothetical protein